MNPAQQRNIQLRNQIKSHIRSVDAFERCLHDETRRYVWPGMQMFCRTQNEKMNLMLYSKRGMILPSHIRLVKKLMQERGWQFEREGVLTVGIWEGIFIRKES